MADFTEKELKERIIKLQDFLAKKKIALAVLNQNSDIYYYTGSIQPLYLLIPAVGESVVLARKAINRIQDEVHHLKAEAFYSSKDLARIIERFNLNSSQRIGLTIDTTSYSTVIRWQQLFGGAEIVDLSLDIRMLRLVKSPAEIAIQTKAGEIMAQLPKLIKANFKPGMTELALSALIENYFRLNGHEVLVRCRREGIEMGFGVCAAGVNTLTGTKFDGVCAGKGVSAAVPYGASWDPIPPNVPVMLDYAFNYQGYHVDQTRMFCWGKPSAEIIRAYRAMVQVEEAIINVLRPGVLWYKIYDNVLKLAGELGYEAEFMGLGAEKVRFIGHGVGLELDEPPFLAPKMEYPITAGMVIAIEPKVAFPELGVIGVEDTLVVTDAGSKLITTCSKEFIIVE